MEAGGEGRKARAGCPPMNCSPATGIFIPTAIFWATTRPILNCIFQHAAIGGTGRALERTERRSADCVQARTHHTATPAGAPQIEELCAAHCEALYLPMIIAIFGKHFEMKQMPASQPGPES